MSDKEHIWIPKLKQQLADKKIDRREFVRYASLLGMSSGAAYMWAGKITGRAPRTAGHGAGNAQGRHPQDRPAHPQGREPAYFFLGL